MAIVTPLEAQRMLEAVNPHNYFFFAGGEAAKSLPELAEIMGRISDNEFSYHASGENNDFRNWILLCVRDEDLAKQIGDHIARDKIISLVKSRVKELEAAAREPAPSKKISMPIVSKEKIKALLRAIRQHNKEYQVSATTHHLRIGAKEFAHGIVMGIIIGIIISRAII